MPIPLIPPEAAREKAGVPGLAPIDEESPPSTWERIQFLFYVIIPWLVLYGVTAKLGLHGTSFGMPYEDRLPVIPWTAPVYQSIYVVIALTPWWVRTRRDLRQLMVCAWLSMAVVFPFYWLVPSSAPRRPLLSHGWIATTLGVERSAFPPVAAFPSFHVLWVIFLARASRPRLVGWCYAGLIAVSCITTGQHYVADVLASMVLAPGFIWTEQRLTEGLAKFRQR